MVRLLDAKNRPANQKFKRVKLFQTSGQEPVG